MTGKMRYEQLWRWRHEDAPDDTLLYFPEAKVSTVEITGVLDRDTVVSLGDIEWLLLHYKGKFTLFVRGHQEPEEQLSDDQVGTHYADLLRYKPLGTPGAGETVWLLDDTKDLGSMSGYYQARWRDRAVLAIRRDDATGEHNIQILCSEPTGPASGYCQAYCCPPQKAVHKTLGRLFGCDMICPHHWT